MTRNRETFRYVQRSRHEGPSQSNVPRRHGRARRTPVRPRGGRSLSGRSRNTSTRTRIASQRTRRQPPSSGQRRPDRREESERGRKQQRGVSAREDRESNETQDRHGRGAIPAKSNNFSLSDIHSNARRKHSALPSPHAFSILPRPQAPMHQHTTMNTRQSLTAFRHFPTSAVMSGESYWYPNTRSSSVSL